jgi:hypothetical protein
LPSSADKHRRLQRLEQNAHLTRGEERERIKREIERRIWRAITDELGKLSSAGHRRGGPDIWSQPPSKSTMEQLYGEQWTTAQWYEEAVGRVFTRDYLNTIIGIGETYTREDLREHVDLDNAEEIAAAKKAWIEAEKQIHQREGKPWNTVNRFYREKQEEANRRAREQEWGV